MVVSRATWGAVPANRPIQVVPSSRRTGFVVHHSVSGTGLNAAGAMALIRSFQRSHQANGWGDIGYNYLVDAWGNVYEGRGLTAIGAHAGGHNANNFGVCYIGDGRTGEMPELAKQAFRNLYVWLNGQAGKTLTRLVHSDLNSTACPGPFIRNWVKAGGLTAGISFANTTTDGDDMTPDQAAKLDAIYAGLYGPKNLNGGAGPGTLSWVNAPGDVQSAAYGVLPIVINNQQLIATLAARPAIDVPKLAAAIAALLPTADTAKITAAVEAALADDFARVNANVDQIPLGFTITAK